ncbi:hypothetical protein, partial [Enterococcus faecalis]
IDVKKIKKVEALKILERSIQMKKITERPIVKILIKILIFALCFYAGIKFVDFIFPLVGFKQ